MQMEDQLIKIYCLDC